MYFEGEWYEMDDYDDMDNEYESDNYDYTYEDYKADIPDGTYETYLEVVNPRKWDGSPNKPQF